MFWPGADEGQSNLGGDLNTANIKYVQCPRSGAEIEEWDFEGWMASLSTQIDRFLYMGNEDNARTKTQLEYEGHKITHILNCQREGKQYFEKGIEYHVLQVDDKPHERLSDLFAEAINFIEGARRSGGKVLVHSFQGDSRAPTFVIAYLMAVTQITFKKALSLVNKRRKAQNQEPVRPNHGFVRQCRSFEKELGLRAADDIIKADKRKF